MLQIYRQILFINWESVIESAWDTGLENFPNTDVVEAKTYRPLDKI